MRPQPFSYIPRPFQNIPVSASRSSCHGRQHCTVQTLCMYENGRWNPHTHTHTQTHTHMRPSHARQPTTAFFKQASQNISHAGRTKSERGDKPTLEKLSNSPNRTKKKNVPCRAGRRMIPGPTSHSERSCCRLLTPTASGGRRGRKRASKPSP